MEIPHHPKTCQLKNDYVGDVLMVGRQPSKLVPAGSIPVTHSMDFIVVLILMTVFGTLGILGVIAAMCKFLR